MLYPPPLLHSRTYIYYIPRTFVQDCRFHVALRLFSNSLQMTSKCRKNVQKKNCGTQGNSQVPSLLFLPHFEVFCDYFRHFRKKQRRKSFSDGVISASVFSKVRTYQNACMMQLIISIQMTPKHDKNNVLYT